MAQTRDMTSERTTMKATYEYPDGTQATVLDDGPGFAMIYAPGFVGRVALDQVTTILPAAKGWLMIERSN
jgi:hypothetical protein